MELNSMGECVIEFDSLKFCYNVYTNRGPTERKNVCRIYIEKFLLGHVKKGQAELRKSSGQV